MWKSIKKKFSALASPFKKLKAKYKDRKEAAKIAKLEAEVAELEALVALNRKKSFGTLDDLKKSIGSLDKEAELEELFSVSERILAQEKAFREQLNVVRGKEKSLHDALAEAEALIKELDD